MFTHHSKRNGAILIVSYSGSVIDSLRPPMPEFEKAIDGHCSGVVLDLTEVQYINSEGVSSFMNTFKFVRAHGINIVLCSPIPQVFKVLKLARTDLIVPVTDNRSAATRLLTKMASTKHSPSRENILIVQGGLKVKSALSEVLRSTEQYANYNIVTALNPLRAWKILGGKSIQLVILDVTSPMKEGQHLLKQVRTNRELKGLPFLIASDESHLSDAAYYTKNGADDILRFPFNNFETPVRLRTALSLYYNWQASRDSTNETGKGGRPTIR